ncbi:MAG: SDR family oxidoreductase [Planctomycetia bacterium]|nr:MAG: SDR family oxidoreductase [Planctomycetia bacterium]
MGENIKPGSNGNGNGHHHDGEGWSEPRLDLSTHVAVVTGGFRGIGRATSIMLAREGARAVGVVDMAPELGEFCTEANRRLGRDAFVPFNGDVTDAAFRRHVFTSMEKSHGPVSICIPAAGITRDRLAVRVLKESGDVDIYPESDWERVIAVDLTAPVYWGLETIASVARTRGKAGLKRWDPSENVQGCVVFIGSVSSSGNRGQVSYATAKAGLEGAQGTLAAEGVYHGVRCAIIHPGYTDTAMVRALGDEFIRQNIIPQTQLRRLIKPEEIANAILFLIRNPAISGQLWADAGWHPVA